MTPLLEIKDLRLSFLVHGEVSPALKGVSLKLFEGEKLGIVGQSGSGKSVLVKAIVNLLPPHTTVFEGGEIWYKGQNLVGLPEKKLRKIRGKEIGMIFQDPMTSLNPTLKIGAQIQEGLPHHNRSTVVELLRSVGISDPEKRIDEYPHTLSGGMRQRAMIALALAGRPSLLIADEPTTALDVTVQAQILDLLHTVQAGKTTILISHDLSVVAEFCDRIVVMYNGEIVEEATAEDLFARPQHPYTQRLLQELK
jgi:ABC-type dipeptide/oligopeptide/nickel transport system ATPase component